MPLYVATQGQAAQHDRVLEWTAWHILDYEINSVQYQRASRFLNQVRVVAILIEAFRHAELLAWWTGMDDVEFFSVSENKLKGVCLMKLIRVSLLWPIIDADDIEPSAMIPGAATTSTAE